MIRSSPLLSAFARKKTARGITGIGFDPQGVAAVCVERTPDRRPQVALCAYRAFNNGSPTATLASLAHDCQLRRAYCTTLLASDDYKLVMAEAPDVPPDELSAALRWK